MATADKKNKGTPGRKRRTAAGDQQFFDVGKVGRKTGITLEDRGIRDEHGLEPMEHLFSSPTSPQRNNGGGKGTSSDAHMQESSGPDLDMTLTSRKTPRLPPPRASTPRHTNIGSPKRLSTSRPTSRHAATEEVETDASPLRSRAAQPANRVLDFGPGNAAHQSIEDSPFRPKHALRRSVERRPDVFASPKSDVAREETAYVNGAMESEVDPEIEVEVPEAVADDVDQDDGPLLVGEDDDEPDMDGQENQHDGTDEPVQPLPRVTRNSLRNSLNNSSMIEDSSGGPPKRKRGRPRHDRGQDEASIAAAEEGSSRAQKRQRSHDQVEVRRDDEEATTHPPTLSGDHEGVEEGPGESAVNETEVSTKGQPRKRGRKPGRKPKVPSVQDPNRAVRAADGATANDMVKSRASKINGVRASVGPSSNFALRATTPFEDAKAMTRSGRAVIEPLKFWANERVTYRNGMADGLIRADEVEQPRQKRRGPKRRTKKSARDADESSDAESVMADEWEAEVGVISGDVANWNSEIGEGDAEDLIHEDLAHAEQSLTKREVAGLSNFTFSKILTMPFFGAGVVELPPEGFKSSKNSKKMQLAFFVHKGKVMVEVNPPGEVATNQFAVSRGGVWIVPRGNNYSIVNESRSREAVLFFCQACEMPTAAPAAAHPED